MPGQGRSWHESCCAPCPMVRSGVVMVVWAVGTVACGQSSSGRPAWASECADFDQHGVSCCSGGQGTIEGLFGEQSGTFRVGSGHARQAGCAEPYYQITAGIDAASSGLQSGFLTLSFQLSLDDQTTGVAVDCTLPSDTSSSVTGARTFVNRVGQQATDFALTVDDHQDWHVAGRMWGELVDDASATPASIQVDARFDLDTVYFEWKPD